MSADDALEALEKLNPDTSAQYLRALAKILFCSSVDKSLPCSTKYVRAFLLHLLPKTYLENIMNTKITQMFLQGKQYF
jgi:hypothetical protein